MKTFRTSVSMVRPPTSSPLCLAVAPSLRGAIVVSGWDDGFLRAMRVSDGEVEWEIPAAHEGGVKCITVSGNGAFCVTGGAKGSPPFPLSPHNPFWGQAINSCAEGACRERGKMIGMLSCGE